MIINGHPSPSPTGERHISIDEAGDVFIWNLLAKVVESEGRAVVSIKWRGQGQ
jgi:hypothetical protein